MSKSLRPSPRYSLALAGLLAFAAPAVADADPIGAKIYPGLPVTEDRFLNDVGERAPDQYDMVINQFEVDKNPRYWPRLNPKTKAADTFCNIFVWDVTAAMGAPVATAFDDTTGAPATWDARTGWKGGYQHNANGVADWFVRHGAKFGWRNVSPEQAQRLANAGFPTVLAWKNTRGGSGHVAIVRPDTRPYDAVKGPHIAQAGGSASSPNDRSGNFSSGYGNTSTIGIANKAEIAYWTHD